MRKFALLPLFLGLSLAQVSFAQVRDLFAEFEEEAASKKEELEKLESRFTALGVPVIVDRSAQEEDELAQAEWIKVYGALYGCEEEAEEIFEKIVEEAEKQ